ncbi:nucleotide sugar dehydrogenase [Paenibacillus donghaensis]|uniref:nucleotide sugar dehydrogenase n=1 Tax=Paenibacillus donghaensis TaxID=414771 RepID=UPI001FEB07AA|nr:nucleotide sugar dehydrogenase [Paenibacillus donghaensis]
MKLSVVGLGYIGLPTAVMFANSGMNVHGVDVNPNVIDMIRSKRIHLHEPGMEKALKDAIDTGTFTVSMQPQEADAFIIAVPTPIGPGKTADLSQVVKAAEMLVPILKAGDLVVLESTVPPKTVESLLLPVLRQTNLVIGEQLFVCNSPERVLPGRLFHELKHNDRIVGGVTPLSAQKCAELYERIVQGTIHITDTITAEMVKLMENTYRDVNIALANELARVAEEVGFDIWEAIELANSHPRVHIHSPGPGVGGHCIAVDPWFIFEKAPKAARLIELSRITNDDVPHLVSNRIREMVRDIHKPVITLLGVAFKGDIDDIRESPSLVIINELRTNGYQLKIYDPYVKQDMAEKAPTLHEAVTGSDCIVLLTDHAIFKNIDFDQIGRLMRSRRIIDTRNMVDLNRLRLAGFLCQKIGTQIAHVAAHRDEGR